MIQMGANVGRLVFGATAIAFGLITLAWHEFNGHLLLDMWSAPGGLLFVYAVAAAQIFGGVAIQFRRLAKSGAVTLGVVYLFFTLLWIPQIAATPQIFDPWGNFFEEFTLVVGAGFVYASASTQLKPATVIRVGCVLLGVCALSFAIYQAVHPHYTAGLVPAWLPPNQMFWVMATTIAFALAAVALLLNRAALLAARLMTLMIVLFGLLVWVPLLISDPQKHSNWDEIAENFAIAGAAWIFADLLGKYRSAKINAA